MSHQLAKSGHEISWLCPPETCPIVRVRGLDARPLASDARIRDAAATINARFPHRKRNLAQLAGWWAARRKLRRQSLANDEVVRSVRQLQPDLLLIDHEMHTAIVATAQLNLPTMLPIVWFSIFRDPDLPLMHTDRLPPKNGFQRLINRGRWWRCGAGRCLSQCWETLGPAALRRTVRPLLSQANQRSDLRALATGVNYSLTRETDRWQWLQPHTYRNLPVLCYNVREMDFPHCPHPNLHYVGPMMDLQRPDHLRETESLKLWNAWRGQRAAESTGKPLFYCSLGTFWAADRNLLNQIIDVFRARQEWQLVVGLGGKAAPLDFGTVPDNILLLKYAPQLQVIAQAKVAITHGGVTSINECVALGVPMLVFSTGHVDQDGCAARVQYHGLGLVAERRGSSIESIANHLSQLLNDGQIRANIGRMQDIFSRYREERRAVRTVEEQLSKKSQSHSRKNPANR